MKISLKFRHTCLDREARWPLLSLPATVGPARIQHQAVLVIAGVEVEKNLSLPVAAEIYMDSATAASFVAEKHRGSHGKLVDFYFGGVSHLSLSTPSRASIFAEQHAFLYSRASSAWSGGMARVISTTMRYAPLTVRMRIKFWFLEDPDGLSD